MRSFRVQDVLTDKILISRESARALEGPLRAMWFDDNRPESASGSTNLAVDFAGIEGMAPSFLDELVTILEFIIGVGAKSQGRSFLIVNPPTRLSSKFEAVARGHGMSAQAQPDGSWLLTVHPKSTR
jgi:hypothetical protein